MEKLSAPIFVDSLDKPNAPPTNSAPKVSSNRQQQSVIVILGLTGIFIFSALLLYVLIWLHQMEYVIWANITLWFINAIVVFVLVGAAIACVVWLILLALRTGIWSLDKGVPLSVFRAQQSTIDYQKATMAYFAVLEQRAKQSTYQGVQTLTLDQSSQVDTSTTTVATPQDEVTTEIPETPTKHTTLLEELREKGYINRSDNSIMIGVSKE